MRSPKSSSASLRRRQSFPTVAATSTGPPDMGSGSTAAPSSGGLVTSQSMKLGSRAMSYRELQAATSDDGLGGGLSPDASTHGGMSTAHGSMHFAGRRATRDIVDSKDLSPAEETNLVRLFACFASEVEAESDEDISDEKVLEVDELKNLLLCLGMQVDDEGFERIKSELNTRIPGEIQFDEFVTFMVRSQELRNLRGSMEEAERSHVDNTTAKRFEPDATWRWCWDAMILVLTGYYGLIVSYEWVIPNPMTPPWWAAESCFCVLFILDMLVYVNTVAKDKNGTAVEHLPTLAVNYLKSTFVFDLLGMLPADLIVSASYPDDHHEKVAWYILRALHLFRFVRVSMTLFNGVSVHGFLRPRFVYLQYTLAPVMKALFYFVMIVHYLSIGWLVVQGQSPEHPEPSYIDAVYIVGYSLSTVGFGDMIIQPGAERVYCCFLFICGAMMNGLVISQMSVFLQKADIQNDRKDKMRETLAVLKHFDIPMETQSEILSFQNHLLSHNLGSSHEELMGSLPEKIQESLGLFMRIKFIAMVPMFASSPHDCQEALATTLVNIVFHPHEFIIVAGEIGNEMYFLGHGAADVIGAKGQHFATLRKGGFFGEIALLVDGAPRNASIKALTYCDTFRLEKGDFNRIMHKFPHFRKILEHEVGDRVNKFKEMQAGQPAKAKKRLRKRSEAFAEMFGHEAQKATSDDGKVGMEMPSFEESTAFEASFGPGAQRSAARLQPSHSIAGGVGGVHMREPGERPRKSVMIRHGHGQAQESPRGHRQPRVGFANFNSLAGGTHTGPGSAHPSAGGASLTGMDEDVGHNAARRRTSFRTAAVAGSDQTDQMLVDLVNRVAELERRGNGPPLPSAYGPSSRSTSSVTPTSGGATRSSNAGKAKEPAMGPSNGLGEIISSDDETSAHHSPAIPRLPVPTAALGGDMTPASETSARLASPTGTTPVQPGVVTTA